MRWKWARCLPSSSLCRQSRASERAEAPAKRCSDAKGCACRRSPDISTSPRSRTRSRSSGTSFAMHHLYCTGHASSPTVSGVLLFVARPSDTSTSARSSRLRNPRGAPCAFSEMALGAAVVSVLPADHQPARDLLLSSHEAAGPSRVAAPARGLEPRGRHRQPPLRAPAVTRGKDVSLTFGAPPGPPAAEEGAGNSRKKNSMLDRQTRRHSSALWLCVPHIRARVQLFPQWPVVCFAVLYSLF